MWAPPVNVNNQFALAKRKWSRWSGVHDDGLSEWALAMALAMALLVVVFGHDQDHRTRNRTFLPSLSSDLVGAERRGRQCCGKHCWWLIVSWNEKNESSGWLGRVEGGFGKSSGGWTWEAWAWNGLLSGGGKWSRRFVSFIRFRFPPLASLARAEEKIYIRSWRNDLFFSASLPYHRLNPSSSLPFLASHLHFYQISHLYIPTSHTPNFNLLQKNMKTQTIATAMTMLVTLLVRVAAVPVPQYDTPPPNQSLADQLAALAGSGGDSGAGNAGNAGDSGAGNAVSPWSAWM